MKGIIFIIWRGEKITLSNINCILFHFCDFFSGMKPWNEIRKVQFWLVPLVSIISTTFFPILQMTMKSSQWTRHCKYTLYVLTSMTPKIDNYVDCNAFGRSFQLSDFLSILWFLLKFGFKNGFRLFSFSLPSKIYFFPFKITKVESTLPPKTTVEFYFGKYERFHVFYGIFFISAFTCGEHRSMPDTIIGATTKRTQLVVEFTIIKTTIAWWKSIFCPITW